jgi:RimJ/RimL family protein N-acetyltransferase
MVPTLQTERLLLLPLQLADSEQIQPLFAQWEVVQHLNAVVPWPYPADGAHTYYRDLALPAMARGDEWHWTLRLKSAPDKIMGTIALFRREGNNRGFWLDPQQQNQGLMTEAVYAVNDFWFETLGFRVLRAPKATANIASSRVSQKTGMRLVGIESNHHFVSGPLNAEVWEITADEWRAHKNKGSGETE